MNSYCIAWVFNLDMLYIFEISALNCLAFLPLYVVSLWVKGKTQMTRASTSTTSQVRLLQSPSAADDDIIWHLPEVASSYLTNAMISHTMPICSADKWQAKHSSRYMVAVTHDFVLGDFIIHVQCVVLLIVTEMTHDFVLGDYIMHVYLLHGALNRDGNYMTLFQVITSCMSIALVMTEITTGFDEKFGVLL